MNSLPIKIKEARKNTCSRILTPKQVGPICWFMATFVAMFYSQRSRKILLEASENWDIRKGRIPIFWNKRKKLFTLLKKILDDKYLKSKSRESKDYKKFNDNTFGKILSLLNKVDKKSFPYIPGYVTGGFNPEYYIGKLYKLLNVDSVIYEYNISENVMAYSILNDGFDIVYKIENGDIKIRVNDNKTFKYIEENITPPPILMVVVTDDIDKYNTKFYNKLFPNNILNEGPTKDTLKSMNEKIFYKDVEYNLDSVILSNWNLNEDNGHAISGITCKNNKYIYNGWTRNSMDPVMAKKYITRKIPCELMRHNWNIKYDGDFCLNTLNCIPDFLWKTLDYSDSCFNFSRADRILVYVKKNTKSNTSIESYSYSNISKFTKKSYQDNGTFNTGGYILAKNSINKHIVKSKTPIKRLPKTTKTLKKCPKGKVLNPKTGRYILIRNIK
jgi:hypothetical protein